MRSLELPDGGTAARSCTDSEILRLFHRLRNPSLSDDALELRNRIIVAKRSLVLQLATKFSKDVGLRGDLEGEGVLGLIDAIDRFDPSTGIPFGAYAVHFVRGRMFAVLRASRDIRFNGRVAARVSKLRQIVHQRGDPPELIGDHELAAASGLPIRSVRRLRPYLHDLQRLDPESPIGPSSETIEAAEGGCGPSPARAFQISDDCATLRFALRTLTSREALVIECSFGLNGTEKTSAEIAAWFGISRQRVDQIKQRALEKLRETGWNDMVNPHARKASVFDSALGSVV